MAQTPNILSPPQPVTGTVATEQFAVPLEMRLSADGSTTPDQLRSLTAIELVQASEEGLIGDEQYDFVIHERAASIQPDDVPGLVQIRKDLAQTMQSSEPQADEAQTAAYQDARREAVLIDDVALSLPRGLRKAFTKKAGGNYLDNPAKRLLQSAGEGARRASGGLMGEVGRRPRIASLGAVALTGAVLFTAAKSGDAHAASVMAGHFMPHAHGLLTGRSNTGAANHAGLHGNPVTSPAHAGAHAAHGAGTHHKQPKHHDRVRTEYVSGTAPTEDLHYNALEHGGVEIKVNFHEGYTLMNGHKVDLAKEHLQAAITGNIDGKEVTVNVPMEHGVLQIPAGLLGDAIKNHELMVQVFSQHDGVKEIFTTSLSNGHIFHVGHDIFKELTRHNAATAHGNGNTPDNLLPGSSTTQGTPTEVTLLSDVTHARSDVVTDAVRQVAHHAQSTMDPAQRAAAYEGLASQSVWGEIGDDAVNVLEDVGIPLVLGSGFIYAANLAYGHHKRVKEEEEPREHYRHKTHTMLDVRRAIANNPALGDAYLRLAKGTASTTQLFSTYMNLIEQEAGINTSKAMATHLQSMDITVHPSEIVRYDDRFYYFPQGRDGYDVGSLQAYMRTPATSGAYPDVATMETHLRSMGLDIRDGDITFDNNSGQFQYNARVRNTTARSDNTRELSKPSMHAESFDVRPDQSGKGAKARAKSATQALRGKTQRMPLYEEFLGRPETRRALQELRPLAGTAIAPGLLDEHARLIAARTAATDPVVIRTLTSQIQPVEARIHEQVDIILQGLPRTVAGVGNVPTAQALGVDTLTSQRGNSTGFRNANGTVRAGAGEVEVATILRNLYER